MKRFAPLLVLACSLAACAFASSVSADPTQFGLAGASASLSTNQAGAHPDFTTNFEVSTDPQSNANAFGLKRPYAATRDVHIDLPPGLLGNPNAVAQCAVSELETFSQPGGGCPNASQVGIVKFYAYSLTQAFAEPLYMMRPPSDESAVARLGFIAATVPTYVDVSLRSEGDYGARASVEGASGQQEVVKAETTLWGIPAASSHNTERQTPEEAFNGATSSPPRPPGGTPAPLVTNPTRCGVPLSVDFAVDSYQEPGRFSTLSAPLATIVGCDQVTFSPTLSLTPSSRSAAEPTGLDAELTVPQNESVPGVATSQIRYAKVTLPKGMTIASGAGDGLSACSAAEVGLGTRGAAHCPGASKIGSAQITSPDLSRTIEGAIYQRTPIKGDLFGIWLTADELGIHLKLPAEVHADPVDGQLSAFFEGTPQTEGIPQAPVSRFSLHFRSGPRAPLAAPDSCGTYYAHYEFDPWSGRAPVQADVPMRFDQGCDTGGFSPRLSAGSSSPLAGAFTSFLTTLVLGSGEQNVANFNVILPKGISAKLAGVGLCEGALAATGNCPLSSLIGSANVAAGPGPSPLWLPQSGREPITVYLSGPYKGAPFGLVVKTPAQAGPFDLGTVITRAGIYVDPETAQVTVKSDPLPQILEGVPVSYRTIHVAVDRPGFALNPTSCLTMRTQARVTSDQGVVATPSSRFRVAGCRDLGLSPQLSLRLFGKTNRGAHPRFRAVLKPHRGDANLLRVQATLPRSEFIENAHFNTICTRVQFAAGKCPSGSIYGHVTAVTPLLEKPLEGPVYLRSSNHKLPDLVVALKGQVDFNAVARVDSVNGGIRTTFEALPDVPLTKVVLSMHGASKGLFVNSRNLCAAPSKARIDVSGQNGKTRRLRVLLRNGCPHGNAAPKFHH